MSDWLDDNRANWDERVALHLSAPAYDLSALRSGQGRLHPIEEAELGDVAGQRVLHLQCHFGRDSLILAQRGALVTGVDFSPPAIAAATELARSLSVEARFVLSDVYGAPDVLAEPASFDVVFVTWGTTVWLPDIAHWARVVAHFLRPGGRLYFADGHPFAYVFDDLAPGNDGRPGWLVPYLEPGPLVLDDERDYADPAARLVHKRTHSWLHTLSATLAGLDAAGLQLEWLHEHDTVPWQMFACLTARDGGMFGWPDRPWLPLSFSLQARRRL